MHESITKSRQIKAARILLDWSQEDLAHAANLPIATIRKLEAGSIPRHTTLQFVRHALEKNGLEFIEPGGVRYRLPSNGELLEIRLTPRETEIVKWTARGKTYGEISAFLSITEDTIKAHIENARCKLNAANKTHVVALAIFQGLIKLDDAESKNN